MVVAAVLVGQFAVTPLAGQIRVPLPGEDAKPKILKKKRFVPPTIPQRNPIRAPGASISAEVAPSATSAVAVEASSAAGTVSSDSAAIVAAFAAKPGDAPETPLATASLPADTDTRAAGPGDGETATAEPAGDDSNPAPDTADAAASKDSPTEDSPTEDSSSEDSPSEELASIDETSEPAAEAEPEPVEPSVTESSDSESSDTASTDDEPSGTEPPGTETASEPEEVAPVETAEAPQDDPVDEPGSMPELPSDAPSTATIEDVVAASEPEAPKPDAAPVETTEEAVEDLDDAPIAAAAPEPVAPADPEPAETVEMAAPPSHDASVVLEVLPPPEPAATSSPEASTQEVDTQEAEKPAGDPPLEMAAITPPNEPVPVESPSVTEEAPAANETPAETESAPDESASDETAAATGDDEAGPAAASEPPSSEGATPAAGADERLMPDETATEPTAPPAHPVVAAIRAELAEPDFQKAADGAELKGLEGFYEAHEGPPLWITDTGFSVKAKALIAEIGKADDWGLDARAFDLPKPDASPATPEAQAAAELKLSLAALKYARHAQGGRRRPSAYSPLFDQNPPIRDSKTVLAEMAAASKPDAYLTSLHPQHDQFKRLHAALQKARATARANGGKPSNDRDVQLLAVNMERWRWLPRNLGSYHVWNNVPEFNVRVMKGGKAIYTERTIVGQLQYATPFFSAPMRNIVFHPNWTVPPTIVKEDLAPKLQSPRGMFDASKTDTLRRYGLSVSFKGEPIDADSVDWNKVNVHAYTFTQDPGPTNVLGKFKFNFPNRHAIYMHDTVQPELFTETTRTLSHGCIRVRDPNRLAALLLGEDKGWSPGQVERLLAQDTSTAIALNRKVPVHLTYFTAAIDENGQLNRFGDIYGIDNRMAAKLFDNPARFPIPATPAIAEAASPSRDEGRSRQRGGGLDSLISGLFGN